MNLNQFSTFNPLYAGLTILLFILTGAAALAMRVTQKTIGIKKYLSTIDYLKKNRKTLEFTMVLYYIFLLLPILLLIIIVILLIVAYGAYPGVPYLFYGSFFIVFCIPSTDKMFYYKVLILAILFVTAQLVTVFLNPAYNYSNYSYTYFVLSVVFLILNGVFSSIFVWLISGKQWALEDSLGFIYDEFIKLCPVWQQKSTPPRLLSGGFYSYICNIEEKKLFNMCLLIFNWTILVIYAVIVKYTTTYGILGCVNAIAVFTTDIVVYTIMQLQDETFSSPNRLSILIMLIRICLFGFTAQYWFMGYCLLYIFFMAYMSIEIIEKHYPNFEKVPSAQVTQTDIIKMPEFPAVFVTLLFSAIIFFLGNQKQIVIPTSTIMIGQTSYPFWAIGIGSILFSISLFFYLTSVRLLQRKSHHIRDYQKLYFIFKGFSQYYIFLSLAYLMIVIYGCYFYATVGNVFIVISCVFLPLIYETFVCFYRNWSENDFLILGNVENFNKKYKRALQMQEKIDQKKQQMLNKIKNDAKLQLKHTLTNFQGSPLKNSKVTPKVENPVSIDPQKDPKNVKISPNVNLKEEQEQQLSKFSIGMNKIRQEQSQIQFFQQMMQKKKSSSSTYLDWREKYSFWQALRKNLLLPTDVKIIFMLPTQILLLLGYGLAGYFGDNHDMTAFTISVELLFLFLTFMLIRRFFATLSSPELIQIILFISGLILNFVYGGMGVLNGWSNHIGWSIWWGFINPMILLGYCTYGLLQDNGVSALSVIFGFLTMIVGFAMGIFVLIKSTYINGIIILGIFVYLTFFMISYFYYLRDHKLPKYYFQVTLLLLIITAIGVTVALYFVIGYDGFLTFSIAYLIITFIIGFYSFYLLSKDISANSQVPNFYSPYGQVFKYQPTIQSSVTNDHPLNFLIVFLLLIFFYSILLQFFISPVQVGLSFTCIFEILGSLVFFYFQTFNTYNAGKLQNGITEQIIKQSWVEEKAILLKLKTIDEDEESLQKKYQEQLLNYQDEFNNAQTEERKAELFIHISDLEQKLQKQMEEELLVGVNLWLRIMKKVQGIYKQKWNLYVGFIHTQSQMLMDLGIMIMVDPLQDTEGKYLQIKRDIAFLTPQQKIKFEYNFKIYQLQREQIEKQLQEKRKEDELIKRKREEDLLNKLNQQKDIDDSNFPIEKMRDSPMKLKKILENQKNTNTPYVDVSFKADKSTLPSNIISLCQGFKRPSTTSSLIIGQDTGMNVKQGQIGDCYLISSIGISTRKYLNQIFGIGQWQNPKGCYMVKFQKMNKSIYVIVDDQFPVDSNGEWLLGKCENPRQIYVNVIEKAYAKLHGGYKNIVGGKVNITLSQFTGGFPEEILLKKFQESNTSQLYDRILKYYNLGYLLGAGSPENIDGDSVNIEGVIQGHAYEILKVKILDGNKLIKLRNPHGNGGAEWTGDWSDGSEKWTQRYLNLIGQPVKSQDGAFWMSIEDFVYCYKSLYICRIFDNQIWKKVKASGYWKQQKAAGLPSKQYPSAKMNKNPHYGIKVNRKSTLFVQLQQNQLSGTYKGKNFIFFMVQKNNGKRIKTSSIEKLCGKCEAPMNTYQVSGEIILQAPSYPYTFSLMVSCINPGDEGTYNLLMYCDDMYYQVIDDDKFDN